MSRGRRSPAGKREMTGGEPGLVISSQEYTNAGCSSRLDQEGKFG